MSILDFEDLHNEETKIKAFEKIVKSYTKPLYTQIRRFVQYHDDANDVLQNTFLKIWQNLDTFRGECKLSTWIYRIAINESLTFLQKKKDSISIDDEDYLQLQNLESDPYFDGDETQLQLQKAIATLPEKQRIVFNLKYFDEMKYEEMSQLLDTSVGALKASYHLATKKIEQYFHNLD